MPRGIRGILFLRKRVTGSQQSVTESKCREETGKSAAYDLKAEAAVIGPTYDQFILA